MTVACCLLSIVAILPQLELRAKYGFRGTLVTPTLESSAKVRFDGVEVVGFVEWGVIDISFPPDFASVPRPFNDGWSAFYQRIGLQSPKREMVWPLPTWLEACRDNEIQDKRIRRTQIAMMERIADGYGYAPVGLTLESIGPTVFEDGWESFDAALQESLNIIPYESCEQWRVWSILAEPELHARYGVRDKKVTPTTESAADAGSHGDICFPPDFRPFNVGWADLLKRFALQNPNHNSLAGIWPMCLEAYRPDEIQERQLKIGKTLVDAGQPVQVPSFYETMCGRHELPPIGNWATVFDDGWESFDRALWENRGSVSRDWYDFCAESRGIVSRDWYKVWVERGGY